MSEYILIGIAVVTPSVFTVLTLWMRVLFKKKLAEAKKVYWKNILEVKKELDQKEDTIRSIKANSTYQKVREVEEKLASLDKAIVPQNLHTYDSVVGKSDLEDATKILQSEKTLYYWTCKKDYYKGSIPFLMDHIEIMSPDHKHRPDNVKKHKDGRYVLSHKDGYHYNIFAESISEDPVKALIKWKAAFLFFQEDIYKKRIKNAETQYKTMKEYVCSYVESFGKKEGVE